MPPLVPGRADQALKLDCSVNYDAESFDGGADFCPLPISPRTSKSSLLAATLALPLCMTMGLSPSTAIGANAFSSARFCGLSDSIRRARESLESGIARSYLGGVERGQRNIALFNICRLADAPGIGPAKLMTFE